MAQQDIDKRIVYCLAERQNPRDTDQGFLKPVFEETVDGINPVGNNDFVKNGLIHVTKGYGKFSSEKEGQFFKVEAGVSRSWDENDSHDGISKFVTYDKLAEPAKYLDICLIIDSEYPDPGSVEGLVCEYNQLPVDGFFIRCLNPHGKKIIIGPLDVSKEAVREENGQFYFKYKAPDKPFGGEWKKLNAVPHGSLVFDLDLIPSNVIVNTQYNDYLINLRNLPHHSSYLIDLSTDENLLKWASRLLKIAKPELNNNLQGLRDLISKLSYDTTIPENIFEERKRRLEDMPGKFSRIPDFDQILSDYLRTQEGQKIIKGYVDTNKHGLLEEYFSEELSKTSEKAQDSAKNEIQEKEQKIRSLKNEIESLEQIKNEIETSKISGDVEALRKEIDRLRNEKNIIHDVDKLNIQKELLTEEIDRIKEKHREAESLLGKVQDNFGKKIEENKLKLIELKTGLDAISGNIKTNVELKANVATNIIFNNVSGKGDDARREIVEKITSNLKRRGRVVNRDDVAILLTCILQNLIVTLAGKPGSGKSSTVFELARGLGLLGSNKYIHVQVQRGWSSDRDLIGFYNKLGNSYEPDRFGLFRLLNGLQEVSYEHQFAIVLLDEANLSPIEHYWTDFMGACDKPDTFAVSGSTPGSSIKLPKALRFVATINYDRTTETLSKRYLDRSPVIYLDSSINSFLDHEYTDFVNNEDDLVANYGFDELEMAFGVRGSDASLKPDEERIMREILEEHKFLDIKNYRKIKAIINFTETLRYFLSEDKSDMLKAFDYALLIFALPLISGQGRDYSKSIKSFYEYIASQGLTRTSERIKSIIANSQFETYSYFS